MSDDRLGATRIWSTRLVYACPIIWLTLAAAYTVRVLGGDPMLPAPLNAILFLTLSTLVAGALAFKCTFLVLDALKDLAVAQDRRDGQLYAMLSRRFAALRCTQNALENTVDLTRVRAAVGVPTVYTPATPIAPAGELEWPTGAFDAELRGLMFRDFTDGHPRDREADEPER